MQNEDLMNNKILKNQSFCTFGYGKWKNLCEVGFNTNPC